MLSLGPGVQIVLATEPVDLRRGHDGLITLVRSKWKADPYSGTLFVSWDADGTAPRSCADGTYATALARLARVDVLVIDDFAVAPLNDKERSDLLEILEDRYGLRSTIITSQLPPGDWHQYLGDPTVADAICDRLVNNAHRIVLKGPSRRKLDPVKHQET